jgi:hypothetical protein
MVATMVGVWRSLRLAEVWSKAVGLVLVSLVGIWLQSRVKMFPHLIYFIKTLYKLWASLAIFEDNAEIIYISLLFNTKTFIPVNFDGSYARLVKYINKS